MKNNTKPIVAGSVLQDRKLIAMSETVKHIKRLCDMDVTIYPNVYPPGTDSIVLTDTVKTSEGEVCLDIGTGTGIVALKMRKLGASRVVGVDMNPRSVENAKENAKIMQLSNIEFKISDLFNNVQEEQFDVIAFNPPYTDKLASNEIDICFFDKEHAIVHRFFQRARNYLKTNGRIYLAWSNISDKPDLIKELADQYNFHYEVHATRTGGRGYEFYACLLKTKL